MKGTGHSAATAVSSPRVYLYAVLAHRPRGRLGRGLSGEPLDVLEGPGLWAVTGTMARPPRVGVPALRRHDAVVRALAAKADALLPARFGSFLAHDALLAGLEQRQAELSQALGVVHGCEQMTLRVYLPASSATRTSSSALAGVNPGGGPGTRYLRRRQALVQRAADVPEIAPLRAALDGLVRAERAERAHGARPAAGSQLVASVYHLIPRGRERTYAAIVEAGAPALRPHSIVVSGPSPAYAFAPQSHA